MAWHINCNDRGNCGRTTGASNIVVLIDHHRNEDGYFQCGHCGSSGYIEKTFRLQEPGETWNPYLKGIIRLGDSPDDTYQPFVFLVSNQPEEPPSQLWFSYYKDTRPSGGKLKLGYGPGGPPVLSASRVAQLVVELRQLNVLPGDP